MLNRFPFSARSAMILRSALISSALLFVPTATLAQSVNYAELEQLFGEPVTTSVTGKPQRASEAPASLVIITQDDIRRSPAKDIPGLIQAYAGIDVVRWTGGQSDVAVRGGVQAFNPRLLVLVNGRQVYLDFFGMVNWAGLGVQLDEIQQIEVVRGPNSALFGFNAASGVVNIITIDPLQTRHVTMTAEAGNDGQRRVSGVAAFRLNDWLGLRVSGGYDEANEFEGLGTSAIASQNSTLAFDPRHKEAAGEIYIRPDSRTDARISGSYSFTRSTDLLPSLNSFPSYYRFSSIGGSISHDTGWGIVSLRALHNVSNIDSLSQGTDVGVFFRNKVSVVSADALVRLGTSNTIRVGLEYRRNELKASPGYPGATRYDVLAGSAMWERQFGDVATVTIAARMDHLALDQQGAIDQPTIFVKDDYNRSITAWSVNSALLYKLSDVDSVRIAASQGIQAPSLFSFGERIAFPIPGTPLQIALSGNPYMKPVKTRSAEIAFIRALGKNSRLELTAFYNRTTDVIGVGGASTPPRATPPAYPFILVTADNVGAFTAYGLEASLSGRFGSNWPWQLNYSWTKADQDIVGNSGGVFQRPLALDSATPEHKIKAQISHERGPWLATIAARYTSPISQLFATGLGESVPLRLAKIPDSLALDAKLAFKMSDHVTFAITGDNLTRAAGASLSPVPAERKLRASVQVRF